MKNYEISFIVRPDLEKDAAIKIAKEYEKVLVSHKAKVLSSKELGQKELAYTIKNQKTGYYLFRSNIQPCFWIFNLP